MIDLFILLAVTIIAIQFWQLRGMTETAKTRIHQYADKYQLQIVSVSRKRVRLSKGKRSLYWHGEYGFEFSSTGKNIYQGTMICAEGKKVIFDVPAYQLQTED